MLAAFVVGYFSPWAACLNGLIRWMIVVMMFLVMLQVKFTLRSIRLIHLTILGANLAVGLGFWLIFTIADQPLLAQAAFFTGITPTATAAPVIVGMLHERIDFAVSAFLATNLGMAVCFPFLIPLAIGNPAPTVFWDVIGNLAIVIGIPVLAAIPVRCCYAKAAEIPRRLANFSFFLCNCRFHCQAEMKNLLLNAAGAMDQDKLSIFRMVKKFFPGIHRLKILL